MGVDRDQSIVCCAASKSVGTRVQGTLQLGTSRRVGASVDTAIGSLVAGLEVTSLTLLISVVLDEEVPAQVGVFRGPRAESGNGVVGVCALVVTGFDEKGLVTSEGKAGGQRL